MSKTVIRLCDKCSHRMAVSYLAFGYYPTNTDYLCDDCINRIKKAIGKERPQSFSIEGKVEQ